MKFVYLEKRAKLVANETLRPIIFPYLNKGEMLLEIELFLLENCIEDYVAVI